MNGDTVYEVVMKLIGEIRPIGESNADRDRFDNLMKLTKLVDKLVYEIDNIIIYKTRPEYSMKKAGVFADNFLIELGIEQ